MATAGCRLLHVGASSSAINRRALPTITTPMRCCRRTAKLPLIIAVNEMFKDTKFRYRGCPLQEIAAMDEDSWGSFSATNENVDTPGGNTFFLLSSSEGEESDVEVITNYTDEIDVPTVKRRDESLDAAWTLTAHRIATIQKGRRWKRIWRGTLINFSLIVFLVFYLLLIDWWGWRVVRLPLEPFYLTYPFAVSALFSTFAGWLFIPIMDSVNAHQLLKKGPITHSFKTVTSSMGGLFFIPIGVSVAIKTLGQHSYQAVGAALATLAFATIGIIGDILRYLRNSNCGLPIWMKLLLEVAVGVWFSFWLGSADIATPYSMKMLIPLPPPMGLLYLGKLYLLLSTLSFPLLASGVNLTEDLDGLAGGTCALAFVGMAVAVLPICPDLAIFGSSMSGACVGFLFHNRYRSSVFMGDTGALALGGALTAMAACTGMFLPLLISSGVFVLEVLSVIAQIGSIRTAKRIYRSSRRVLWIATLHHHLQLHGVKKPVIVAISYIVSLYQASWPYMLDMSV